MAALPLLAHDGFLVEQGADSVGRNRRVPEHLFSLCPASWQSFRRPRMNFLQLTLRRPLTVVVLVIAVTLGALMAVKR